MQFHGRLPGVAPSIGPDEKIASDGRRKLRQSQRSPTCDGPQRGDNLMIVEGRKPSRAINRLRSAEPNDAASCSSRSRRDRSDDVVVRGEIHVPTPALA